MGETEKRYADADWELQGHRHSISAYTFQINGGTVSWTCWKQSIITLSPTKVQFISLTHVSKETLKLHHFITEIFQHKDFVKADEICNPDRDPILIKRFVEIQNNMIWKS